MFGVFLKAVLKSTCSSLHLAVGLFCKYDRLLRDGSLDAKALVRCEEDDRVKENAVAID